MSKRCIRPLVALSSRLPAPGAGAENAAIRTGDRMVPPAAHSESRLRAAVLRFAPADGRYAPSRLTTGVCPLPLGRGGRRAPPRLPPGCRSALRLPPFAVRTAFAAPPFGASRRADMIRRSTPASDFRSGAAKSDTRFAPADGRYAPSRLTTGVCPLPLGRGGRRAPPRLPPGCRSALRLPPFAVRSRTAPSSRPCAASIAGAPPAGG